MDQHHQESNQKESGYLQEVKSSNLKLPKNKFKRMAVFLIVAGYIWLLLSGIFYFLMHSKLDCSSNSCGPGLSEYSVATNSETTIYYVVNSILLIVSGILLSLRKKAGFYLFIGLCISIAASLFIKAGPGDRVLFINTLINLFIGGIFMFPPLLIPALGLLSWIFLSINIVALMKGKWYSYIFTSEGDSLDQAPIPVRFHYIPLAIVGIVCVISALYFSRYRFLHPRQVAINEVFTIHKGETVTFGADNYLKYCGDVGSAWGGDEGITLEVKIGTVIHRPCARIYQLHSPYGQTELPYRIEEMNSNPTQLIIRTPDQHYAVIFDRANKEEKPTYFPGSTRFSEEEFYKRTYFSYIFNQNYPKFCSMQTRYPADECLSIYTENFRETCNINTEYKANLWSDKFPNMDECLFDKITKQRIHSDNCFLLIEDTTLRNICFEERKKEEDYLETLRN